MSKMSNIDDQCRYGMSRVFCRGPKRHLTGRYVTTIGGSLTYGAGAHQPYPSMLERQIKQSCVNFGVQHAGIDLHLADATLLKASVEARAVVVELTGACNHSNRLYRVHPRRNDHIVWISPRLKNLFKTVNFEYVTYTYDLLKLLHDESDAYFEIVRRELTESWLERMHLLLDQLGRHVVLLYVSEHELDDQPWHMRPDPLSADPLFLTRTMVNELRTRVFDLVEVVQNPSPIHRSANDDASVKAARSVVQHSAIAQALAPSLTKVLDLAA